VTRIGPIFAWVLLAFCVAHGQAPSLVESCDTAPDQLATDSLLAQNGIAPRQPASMPPAGQKSEQEPEAKKKEESQRVLGVIPHFGVTDRQDADPLRPREKFRLFLKSAFDPVTIGIVGVQAGLSQADNSFPDYGQGAQGYGKRFGAAFADEVAAGFFSNFAYPSLLKQDPRYFRMGNASSTASSRSSSLTPTVADGHFIFQTCWARSPGEVSPTSTILPAIAASH
jgi:hypothetical protein